MDYFERFKNAASAAKWASDCKNARGKEAEEFTADDVDAAFDIEDSILATMKPEPMRKRRKIRTFAD